MIGDVKTSSRQLAILALLAAGLILSACGSGSREIRGELPLIRFEGLTLDGDQASLDIGLRNLNDRSLNLSELKVRFFIEQSLLVDASRDFNIDISARGREVFTLRSPGEREGLRALQREFATEGQSSASPAGRNAGWRMELTLIDEEGREAEASAQGFLHPVPGRPGQFR
jgi:hypothetical protein